MHKQTPSSKTEMLVKCCTATINEEAVRLFMRKKLLPATITGPRECAAVGK